MYIYYSILLHSRVKYEEAVLPCSEKLKLQLSSDMRESLFGLLKISINVSNLIFLRMRKTKYRYQMVIVNNYLSFYSKLELLSS